MKTARWMISSLCLAALATVCSAQPAPTPPPGGNILLYSLQLRDAPLGVALDRLQTLTGKNVVVDPGLAATVTISTPEKLTADEVVALITQALAAQGIRLEQSGDTIHVRGTPKPESEAQSAGARP
jgi:type II secretory pathway component GspD/PulD (secretin)